MSKKLVILGAGGYANTVKDVSEQLGYDVIAMPVSYTHLTLPTN